MIGENDRGCSADAENALGKNVPQYASGGAPGMEMSEKRQDAPDFNGIAADSEDLLMIQLSSFEGRADQGR